MGLFDTVIVNTKLPFNQELIDLGLANYPVSLQTKDLDCCMATYNVSRAGFLTLRKFKESHFVKDEESILGGYIESTDPYDEDQLLTQTIKAYDYVSDVQGKWDVWFEFELTFLDGRLMKSRLIEYNIEDNAPRKAREAEFMRQREIECGKFYNKYFFHTKPWRWCSRKIRFSLYKLGDSMHKLSYHVP